MGKSISLADMLFIHAALFSPAVSTTLVVFLQNIALLVAVFDLTNTTKYPRKGSKLIKNATLIRYRHIYMYILKRVRVFIKRNKEVN